MTRTESSVPIKDADVSVGTPATYYAGTTWGTCEPDKRALGRTWARSVLSLANFQLACSRTDEACGTY